MSYRFSGGIAYCQSRLCIKANNGEQAPVVDTRQHEAWHDSQPLALYIAGQRQRRRWYGVIPFYERRRLAS